MQETQEMWVRSLGQEDPLKQEMATHSGMLSWKIAWTEEPGRLQSTGSQRVGHDFTFFHLVKTYIFKNIYISFISFGVKIEVHL